jgi:hypothetical protein
MTQIPEQTDNAMKRLLEKLADALCPQRLDASPTVRRHVWRDADYVGAANGKVAVWQGWSVNLRACRRAVGNVYIDYADNVLPVSERSRLFGDVFSSRIASIDSFVYAFTTRLPSEVETQLASHGYVIRTLSRGLHAGLLTAEKDFIQTPKQDWIVQLIRLLEFKAALHT